ncbi:MAG: hypothetical protein ACKO38_11925 [Planctomycetota bacterium]
MSFDRTADDFAAALDLVDLDNADMLRGLRNSFEQALGIAPAYSADPLDWIKQYWAEHIQPILDVTGDQLNTRIAAAQDEARQRCATLSRETRETVVRTWRGTQDYIDAMEAEGFSGPKTQKLIILTVTADVLQKFLPASNPLGCFTYTDWLFVGLFYLRFVKPPKS